MDANRCRYALLVCWVAAFLGATDAMTTTTTAPKSSLSPSVTSNNLTALPTPPTSSSPPTASPTPPTTTPAPRPSTTTTPTPTTTGGGGGSDLGKGVGIGVGVTLCVVGVVVAVMVVVLWRRGWVLPCAATTAAGGGGGDGGEVAGDRPPAKGGPAPTSPREHPSNQGEGNQYDGLVVDSSQSGAQRYYEGLRPLSDNPSKPKDAGKKKAKPAKKRAETVGEGGAGGRKEEDSSLDPPQGVYQNWERAEPPSGPPDSGPRSPKKHRGGGGSETLTLSEAAVDSDTVRVTMEAGDHSPPAENVYENTTLR